MRRAARLVLLGAGLSITMARAQAPRLADYDCTRTDDGKSVSGDTLAAMGFAITSQARFGSVNLMLTDPKTKVRANCFKRPPK